MGAAFVSKNRRLQAKSVAVHGSPSSSRPELTAIGLACEDSPIDEELTILTDILSRMNLLKIEERFSTLAVSSRGATAFDTCGQPD